MYKYQYEKVTRISCLFPSLQNHFHGGEEHLQTETLKNSKNGGIEPTTPTLAPNAAATTDAAASATALPDAASSPEAAAATGGHVEVPQRSGFNPEPTR